MLSADIALVTGASRGIGMAIAARLAADGARVIGTATTADGAARISENLASHGGRGAVLDVVDQASIDALLEDIGGRIHDPRINVAEFLKREQPRAVIGVLEHKRRRLVNRNCARARGWIGSVSVMQRPGVESELAVDFLVVWHLSIIVPPRSDDVLHGGSDRSPRQKNAIVAICTAAADRYRSSVRNSSASFRFRRRTRSISSSSAMHFSLADEVQPVNQKRIPAFVTAENFQQVNCLAPTYFEHAFADSPVDDGYVETPSRVNHEPTTTNAVPRSCTIN